MQPPAPFLPFRYKLACTRHTSCTREAFVAKYRPSATLPEYSYARRFYYIFHPQQKFTIVTRSLSHNRPIPFLHSHLYLRTLLTNNSGLPTKLLHFACGTSKYSSVARFHIVNSHHFDRLSDASTTQLAEYLFST